MRWQQGFPQPTRQFFICHFYHFRFIRTVTQKISFLTFRCCRISVSLTFGLHLFFCSVFRSHKSKLSMIYFLKMVWLILIGNIYLFNISTYVSIYLSIYLSVYIIYIYFLYIFIYLRCEYI